MGTYIPSARTRATRKLINKDLPVRGRDPDDEDTKYVTPLVNLPHIYSNRTLFYIFMPFERLSWKRRIPQ